MATTARVSDRTPAQMFALIFGVTYLAIGLIGFAVTGFDQFAENTNEALIVFQINPLHNLVHIAVGGLLLGGSRTHDSAKSINTIVGATYLLVAILGFAGVVVDDLINNNAADNFLHLGTGALALYFGLAGDRGTAATTV